MIKKARSMIKKTHPMIKKARSMIKRKHDL